MATFVQKVSMDEDSTCSCGVYVTLKDDTLGWNSGTNSAPWHTSVSQIVKLEPQMSLRNDMRWS